MIDRLIIFGKRFAVIEGVPIGMVMNVSTEIETKVVPSPSKENITVEVSAYEIRIEAKVKVSTDEIHLWTEWVKKIAEPQGGMVFLIPVKKGDVE